MQFDIQQFDAGRGETRGFHHIVCVSKNKHIPSLEFREFVFFGQAHQVTIEKSRNDLDAPDNRAAYCSAN